MSANRAWTWISFLAAGTVVAPGHAAGADDPTRAVEELVKRADFDAAETQGRTLLASGTLVRAQAARVYFELGVIAAAKRDEPAAEVSFRRSLRLDDQLEVPRSLGPHVIAALARSRAALAGSAQAPPAVAISSIPATASFLVEAGSQVEDDGLARRLRVRVGDRSEVYELGAAPLRLTAALPPSIPGCAEVTGSLLDEFGNELWPAVARAKICRPPPPATAPAVHPEVEAGPLQVTSSSAARPVPGYVWGAAALTGALAVATGVLGFAALDRRDQYQAALDRSAPLDQQSSLREKAANFERLATIGGIAAVVAGATTLWLYWRRPTAQRAAQVAGWDLVAPWLLQARF